jgi:hypothetical protein
MEARVFLAALLALSAAACADRQPSAAGPGTGTRGEPAPLYLAAAGNGVAGEYIVVLQDNSDPARLARAAGVSPRHVYQNSVRGFSGTLAPGQVEAVRRTAGVAYVEQDQLVRATVTDSLPGTLWGLDRVDQRARPLSRTLTYTHTAWA